MTLEPGKAEVKVLVIFWKGLCHGKVEIIIMQKVKEIGEEDGIKPTVSNSINPSMGSNLIA